MTTTTETIALEYGRRCADAVNARDYSLYHHLQKQYVTAWNSQPKNVQIEWAKDYTKAYTSNRII